mmetsp:Transcript_20492/g.42806  ORF Transcript_20492/g.42806 Transcript_20492/m.42806 type:complete len:221 (+) Transcript_20492:1390-2052(+)
MLAATKQRYSSPKPRRQLLRRLRGQFLVGTGTPCRPIATDRCRFGNRRFSSERDEQSLVQPPGHSEQQRRQKEEENERPATALAAGTGGANRSRRKSSPTIPCRERSPRGGADVFSCWPPVAFDHHPRNLGNERDLGRHHQWLCHTPAHERGLYLNGHRSVFFQRCRAGFGNPLRVPKRDGSMRWCHRGKRHPGGCLCSAWMRHHWMDGGSVHDAVLSRL